MPRICAMTRPIHAAAATGPRNDRASTPSGFRTWIGASSIGPGASAELATATTPHAMVAGTKNRHLGPGTRPSGNRRPRNGSAANVTGQAKLDAQADATGAGSDPGFVIYAYVAYSSDKPDRTKAPPIVIISHPMGLPGVRDASSAPTVEYPSTIAIANGMQNLSSAKLPFKVPSVNVVASARISTPQRIHGARARRSLRAHLRSARDRARWCRGPPPRGPPTGGGPP